MSKLIGETLEQSIDGVTTDIVQAALARAQAEPWFVGTAGAVADLCATHKIDLDASIGQLLLCQLQQAGHLCDEFVPMRKGMSLLDSMPPTFFSQTHLLIRKTAGKRLQFVTPDPCKSHEKDRLRKIAEALPEEIRDQLKQTFSSGRYRLGLCFRHQSIVALRSLSDGYGTHLAEWLRARRYSARGTPSTDRRKRVEVVYLKFKEFVEGKTVDGSSRAFSETIGRYIAELAKGWAATALDDFLHGTTMLWPSPQFRDLDGDEPDITSVVPLPPLHELFGFVRRTRQELPRYGSDEPDIADWCETSIKDWETADDNRARHVAKEIGDQVVLTMGNSRVLAKAVGILRRAQQHPRIFHVGTPNKQPPWGPVEQVLSPEQLERFLTEKNPRCKALVTGCIARCELDQHGYMCRPRAAEIADTCRKHGLEVWLAFTDDKACDLCQQDELRSLRRLCAKQWSDRFLREQDVIVLPRFLALEQ